MAREVTLDIGHESGELKHISAAVEALARAEGWPSELTFQVDLVLEELAVNIMRHAYDDGERPGGRITLSCTANSLTIEIVDSGRPFNPLDDVAAPDLDRSLEEREEGGLGVHLVRTLMDEMHHRREGDKNYLTLVKHWKP